MNTLYYRYRLCIALRMESECPSKIKLLCTCQGHPEAKPYPPAAGWTGGNYSHFANNYGQWVLSPDVPGGEVAFPSPGKKTQHKTMFAVPVRVKPLFRGASLTSNPSPIRII